MKPRPPSLCRCLAPWLVVAVVLGTVTPRVPAEAVPDAAVDPDGVFAAAKAAYDAERLDEAVALYTSLEAAGWRAAELDFNLGNALFRLGRVGEAVLHYRRAQYLAPRDPDVRANLAFAWQHAGVTPPRTTWWRVPFLRVTRASWRIAALAAYAAAFLAAAGWILSRRRARTAWGRAAVAASAALVAALVGTEAWRGYRTEPEAVVVTAPADVRFAPLESGVVHFTAPPGTILRIEERDAGWYKVRLADRAGWVTAEGVMPVDPAASRGPAAGSTTP